MMNLDSSSLEWHIVGWARFCAHADANPRGQTKNLSAHPYVIFREHIYRVGMVPALDTPRSTIYHPRSFTLVHEQHQ